jgi:putative ABC transport system permease protein
MGSGADQTPWLTIIGVVEEASYEMLDRRSAPAVYLDAAQLPPSGMTYSIAINGDPLAVAPAARKALAELDATLPLDDLMTYDRSIREGLAGQFYVAAIIGSDALIALLLAAIGIYGVMANLVGERTREIGVRLALGARREDVLQMVLRRAAWLTGTGVCAGLLLALGLGRLVANLLYQVRPDDPWVFGSITAAIAGIALLANWLPASRAAQIDPIVALRDE